MPPLRPERFGKVPDGFTPYQREYLRKLSDAVEILIGAKRSQSDTATIPRSKAVTFGDILDALATELPVEEQRIVGRITGGNVTGLTAAQVLSILLSSTAAGDIPYFSGANTLARLAKAASGNYKLFQNDGLTAPEWGLGHVLKASTKDMAQATGDYSYTGVGFKPSIVVFLFAINGGSACMGIGWTDGATTNHCIRNNGGTFYASPSGCVIANDAGGSQTMVGKTMDADGFTLTATKGGSPTSTLTIFYLPIR